MATTTPVSTATLMSLLDQRGYPNQFVRGLRALGGRVGFVAPAVTARLVPGRPGLAAELGSCSFRELLESVPAGHVLVVDTPGVGSGALIGDLLATRLAARGVAGVVTDGAVRDSQALAELDLAVCAAGVNASPRSSRAELCAVAQPIVCGEVTVLPGDVVVGDADGVVVLPSGQAAELIDLAREQEDLEEYIALRLRAGDSPDGLHPPDAARLADYENWRAGRADEMEKR